MLNLRLGEYEEAERIGRKHLTDVAKRIPEINHIISWLSYISREDSKEKIRKNLSLWAVPEELINLLEENGADLDRKFIYDMFYGAHYSKKILTSEKIFSKVGGHFFKKTI